MIKGKGMYIWKVKECENGVISDIVNKAIMAELSHVIIKIADGKVGYNFTAADGDLAKQLTIDLQAHGIEVWGYQYIYGSDPIGEAVKAATRIDQTGVTGFVINAEKEVRDMHGNGAYVDAYCRRFREAQPSMILALSSYRYPDLHRQLPWSTFAKYIDLWMPQVYWMQAHNPTAQLRETLKQYADLETDLPVIPTGSAFCEWGWCASRDEITEFMNEAQAQELSAVNFWEWSNTVKNNLWQPIHSFLWELDEEPTEPEPPPTDCCDELREDMITYIDTQLKKQNDLIRTDMLFVINKLRDETRELIELLELPETNYSIEIDQKINDFYQLNLRGTLYNLKLKAHSHPQWMSRFFKK